MILRQMKFSKLYFYTFYTNRIVFPITLVVTSYDVYVYRIYYNLIYLIEEYYIITQFINFANFI